jgi:hypothetical protein
MYSAYTSIATISDVAARERSPPKFQSVETSEGNNDIISGTTKVKKELSVECVRVPFWLLQGVA